VWRLIYDFTSHILVVDSGYLAYISLFLAYVERTLTITLFSFSFPAVDAST
jgi:hypothetical protein